ncbi:protein 5NUC isoform X2 [Leptinotarsa decemlineata]|uniref:protein 5NUC isoform X2 n=1 Tax=Leptinotarsa decemlineata TaxID=7539 RepID=UPI003D30AC9D
MSNLFLFGFVLVPLLGAALCDFDLLILHNNDMHSRFEETEPNSGTCKPENKNRSCVGGFARVVHEVRRYRKLAQENKGPPVLFLNAGDTYVGTVWYNLFTWNISQQSINILQPDAVALGNHEFDGGVAGLVPFVNALNSPIVSSNLDFSDEPTLSRVQKSVVLEVAGRKIGIVGHLTQETKIISSPEKTIFLDEIESVKNESERLDSLGIKIIIVLGHSGYLKDQEIAEQVPLVDVVIGGHTNTFLWNGPQPDLEPIDGPYPKVVTQKSGKKVPVVQAYAYTKYLGRLNLTFDDGGSLINFSGQPELLDSSVPQDEDVLQLLETYRPQVNEINTVIVGSSKVTLDGSDRSCRVRECNFGNLLADALVLYKASISPEIWTEAPIGLINGGGIRTTIEPSSDSQDITRGELLAAIPFDNQVVTFKMNGSDLIRTLEIGARSNGETSGGEFLQVSGLKVVYDMNRPSFSRVVSVKVRCGVCDIPTYEDIVPSKTYTIISISFLTGGGDGHYILKNAAEAAKTIEDLNDIDTVVWYFQHYSPVYPEVQGRITFINKNVDDIKDDSSVTRTSKWVLTTVLMILVSITWL